MQSMQANFTFNPRCAIITTWKRRLTVKGNDDVCSST